MKQNLIYEVMPSTSRKQYHFSRLLGGICQ